jgi:hypothetical protein
LASRWSYYLSTHGFDRAVLLIPTWFLLLHLDRGCRPDHRRRRHQRHRRPGVCSAASC